MADEIPPIIQRFRIDPDKEVEARIGEIEKLFGGLEAKFKAVFGSNLSTAGTQQSVDAITGAVKALDSSAVSLRNTFAAALEAINTQAANLEQKISGAARAATSAGRSFTGTGAVGGGAPGLEAEVDSILAQVEASSELGKQFEALFRFSERFGQSFPRVANLVDKGLNELISSTGDLIDRQIRLNQVVKDLSTTQGAIKTEITNRQQLVAVLREQRQAAIDAAGDKPTKQEKEEVDALTKEISELEAVIKKLGIENKVFAQTQGLVEKASKEVASALQAEKQKAEALLEIEKKREDTARKAAQEAAKIQATTERRTESQGRREAEFQSSRPSRVTEAQTAVTDAERQIVIANRQRREAEEALVRSRQRGASPDQQRIATQAQTAAIKAQRDAIQALATAQERLRTVQDRTSGRRAVKEVTDLSNAQQNQAKSSNSATSALLGQAAAFRKVEQPARAAHDVLLAIIGVSRFLPGELGQVISGVGLLSGAFSTSTGIITGFVGTIAALGTKFLELSFIFNDQLNKTRVQAEGLGLLTDEVAAINLIMQESGGSIENVSVGIRNINEAILNIGENAPRATEALRIALGDDFQLQGAKTIDVLQAVFEALDKTSPKFIGVARANVVAGLLFGRSFDEVGGRTSDLNQKLAEVIKKLRETGQAGDEAAKVARDQAKAVRELKTAFDELLFKLEGPKVVTILLKLVTDPVSLFSDVGTATSNLKALTSFLKGPAQLLLEEGFNKLIQGPTLPFGPAGVTTNPLFGSNQNLFKKLGADQKNLTEEQKEELQFSQERDKLSRQLEVLEIKNTDSLETRVAKLEQQKRLLDEAKSIIESSVKNFISVTENAELEVQTLTKEGKSTEEILKKTEERNRLKGQLETRLLQSVDLEKKSNELGKRITELKKAQDRVAPLQLRREELLEESRGFKSTSAEFKKIQDELDSVNEKIISTIQEAGGDPGEIRRAQRQQFQDKLKFAKETSQQLREDFDREFEKRSSEAQEELANFDERVKEQVSVDQDLFERGVQGITRLTNQQLFQANQALSVFIASQHASIERLKHEIARTKTEAESGTGLSQLDADKRINDLEGRIDKENKLIEDATRKQSTKVKELQREERLRLVDARQRQLALELDLVEQESNRRLELLQRAAEASIVIKQKEANERRKIEAQRIQDELDGVLQEFEDLRKIQINAEVKGDPATGLIEHTFDRFLPTQIDRATEEQIEKAIIELQKQGLDASIKAAEQLEKFLLLLERKKNLQQRTEIEQIEDNIELANEALRIRRAEIDIATTLLDIEESRIGFLEQEGLLTSLESRESRIRIERERLQILQDQIRALEDQIKLTAATAAERISKESGAPLTKAQILEIEASPNIAELKQELIGLKGAASEAALRVDVFGSILGQIRSGLDDVIGALDRVPERFDEFSRSLIKFSVRGLADALRGAQRLIDVILKQRNQQKSPAEELKEASTELRDNVDQSAKEFKRVIEEAATNFGRIIAGQAPESGQSAATQDPKKVGLGAVNKTVGKIFTVATGVIEGLSAETIGGKIAGFGQIANAFGPVGMAIGAVASIVGGVADFIGSGFRRRAEKLAKDIEANVELINEEFRNGSITLGEAQAALRAELESARASLGSGKVGKKGGKALLADLERSIQSQIAELKRRAKEIQDKFLEDLEKLRLPEEFRNPLTELEGAFDQVKEFINSFENAADAVEHFGEAQEFLTLTMEGIRKNAEEALKQAQDRLQSIRNQEIQSRREFELQREALINQGRVRTEFDEAKDRLAQLFALVTRRLEEQRKAEQELKEAQDQVKRQSDLIAFLERIFTDFGNRMDRLLDNLENIPDSLGAGGGTTERRPGGLTDQGWSELLRQAQSAGQQARATHSSVSINLTGGLNVNVTGAGESVASRIRDDIRSGLRSINPLSDLLPRGRPVIP